MSVIRYYNIAEIGTVMLPGVVGGLAPRSAVTVMQDAWDADLTYGAVLARGTNVGLYGVALDTTDASSDPSVAAPFETVATNTAASTSNASGKLYIITADMPVWDLPSAAGVAAGWQMWIFFDTALSGGTLCDITADGADTVDTLGDPISMTPSNNYVVLESDGVSDWTTL